VPQNAALLPGVFPVLARIPAIANAPRPLHVVSDPFQQRKRVFTALREMLCLLTERYRLILGAGGEQHVDEQLEPALEVLGIALRELVERLRPAGDRAHAAGRGVLAEQTRDDHPVVVDHQLAERAAALRRSLPLRIKPELVLQAMSSCATSSGALCAQGQGTRKLVIRQLLDHRTVP
jgi:hypothetical protein